QLNKFYLTNHVIETDSLYVKNSHALLLVADWERTELAHLSTIKDGTMSEYSLSNYWCNNCEIH
ncbi:MAG: hypothetical protein WBV84_14425, partial [Nitrososphaeraceae archaeon]